MNPIISKIAIELFLKNHRPGLHPDRDHQEEYSDRMAMDCWSAAQKLVERAPAGLLDKDTSAGFKPEKKS